MSMTPEEIDQLAESLVTKMRQYSRDNPEPSELVREIREENFPEHWERPTTLSEEERSRIREDRINIPDERE